MRVKGGIYEHLDKHKHLLNSFRCYAQPATSSLRSKALLGEIEEGI